MDRRLRVAFVHQPWSIVRPGHAGADSVVLWTEQVARRLARTCDVVCYSRLGDGLPAVERDAWGVEHRRVSGPIDRYLKFAFQQIDLWGLGDPRRPFFASAFAYRQFVAQVARDVHREQPDVVHVHNFSQFLPVLREAMPDESVLALHMHCEWLTQLDRPTVARRLESADLIIGVSDFLRDRIARAFPEHADRCRRVYNGADVDRFAVPDRPKAGPKQVLYVGRVSPEKGVHTLLEAFAAVALERDDVNLAIVGPERVVPYEMIVPFSDDPKVLAMSDWFRGGGGAYGEHLRALVAALPQDRVSFAGQEVEHEELPAHYRAGDVFAFPSIWDEPFGMPPVEAMAAGLPCVATRAGALPEVVEDGRTGLLVDRADPESLAGAILKLCADDALRAEMGAAARERARAKFRWEHVAHALVHEYRSAPVRGAHPAAMTE